MRALIFILMLIFAINALAVSSPRPVQALLAMGSEFRQEKDIDSNLATRSLTNYMVGAGYRSWIGFLERASFQEISGNPTLNVKRSMEDIMLWGQYRALSWNYLVPFFGAGVGYYKEKVDTTLMGTTTGNESKNKFLTGGSFGLSLDIPVAWLSVEGRLLFGDELDRQPTVGALLRAGIYF